MYYLLRHFHNFSSPRDLMTMRDATANTQNKKLHTFSYKTLLLVGAAVGAATSCYFYFAGTPASPSSGSAAVTSSGDSHQPLDMCYSGHLMSNFKIASGEGGMGPLQDGVRFGKSVVYVGDVNGDEVVDLAVGAPNGDDGQDGQAGGAVYILFLNPDDSVKEEHKISSTAEGGLKGPLNDGDSFGWSVAALGLLDDDEVPDLAVGAMWDDEGAVYILFLNRDGTVKGEIKISSSLNCLSGKLDYFDLFGASVAAFGENGDGGLYLAVGAPGDVSGDRLQNGNKGEPGAVYILSLNEQGQEISSPTKISSTTLGGTPVGPLVGDNAKFGWSVAAVGDVDGDTAVDLAVGAPWDDEAGVTAQGAVYIVFMRKDGSVKTAQKISSKHGGLVGPLGIYHLFGSSVVGVGDLDGNGVVDLAVSAPWDNAKGGGQLGKVYIFLMNTDGSVKGEQTFSKGALLGTMENRCWLGGALAAGGEQKKDDGLTVVTLAVGIGGLRGGGVFVIEVPAGFVPVCQENCSPSNEDSYTCGCSAPGYEVAGDGYSCECSAPGYELTGDGACVCSAPGYIITGSGSCECSARGYELAEDGRSCECSAPGYLLTEDGRSCECSAPGYKWWSGFRSCECLTPDYTREQDGTCVDVNECVVTSPRSLCGRSAWCENKIGSYKCWECPFGSKADETGTTCVEVAMVKPPPCVAGRRSLCGAEKRCENKSDGGHKCVPCDKGYHSDRTGGKCVDIDECEDIKSACGAHYLCKNEMGGHKCLWCGAGMKRSEDGKRCESTLVGLGPLGVPGDETEAEHNTSRLSQKVITSASVAGGLLVLLGMAVVVSRVKRRRTAASFHQEQEEEGVSSNSITLSSSGGRSEWTVSNPLVSPPSSSV